MNREFAADKWPQLPVTFWNQAREEARDLIRRDLKLKIMGTDIDDEAVSLARYHEKLAGLEGQIHFQQLPLAQVKNSHKYGCIICNPPYGERLGELQRWKNYTRNETGL